MNYHIADFILRIKNASLARRKQVSMPYSNVSKHIAEVLVKKGFLANIKEEEIDGKRVLLAEVRYVQRKPVVTNVEVISKPSLRVYVNAHDVKMRLTRGIRTAVLSTSQGIMAGDEAKQKGIGGELLFRIW